MGTLQNQIRWCARAQWTMTVATLALAAAFYLLGYRPLTHRLHALHAQIDECERDLMESRLQTKILPDVAGEVEKLRARLERSHKSIPPQQELPQFIRDVTQLSQQAALRPFSYKPGVPARGELVNELPITLNFAGDFVNVYTFLRNTEEMPRLARVRGISIRAKDKTGQVNVQLSMNIYFAAE